MHTCSLTPFSSTEKVCPHYICWQSKQTVMRANNKLQHINSILSQWWCVQLLPYNITRMFISPTYIEQQNAVKTAQEEMGSTLLTKQWIKRLSIQDHQGKAAPDTKFGTQHLQSSQSEHWSIQPSHLHWSFRKPHTQGYKTNILQYLNAPPPPKKNWQNRGPSERIHLTSLYHQGSWRNSQRRPQLKCERQTWNKQFHVGDSMCRHLIDLKKPTTTH